MPDDHIGRLSRRTVLKGAAAVAGLSGMGLLRPTSVLANTVESTRLPTAALTASAVFGGGDYLVVKSFIGEGKPADVKLYRRSGPGAWQPLAGPEGVVRDGVVRPDGTVVLVGAVLTTQSIDLSAASTGPGETYRFEVDVVKPAVWTARPQEGMSWASLPLPGLKQLGLGELTAVAARGRRHVGVFQPAVDTQADEAGATFVFAPRGEDWLVGDPAPNDPSHEGAVVSDVAVGAGGFIALQRSTGDYARILDGGPDGASWEPSSPWLPPRHETDVLLADASVDRGNAFTVGPPGQAPYGLRTGNSAGATYAIALTSDRAAVAAYDVSGRITVREVQVVRN